MKELSPKVKRLLTKPISPLKAIALNLMIITAFTLIQGAASWTNPTQGAINTAIMMPITWFSSLLIVSLWIAIVGAINRWRKKETDELYLMLFPAFLFATLCLFTLIFSPLSAQSSFQRFSKVSFPADAENVKYHVEGGGFHDRSQCYAFTTTPEETKSLIKELQLGEPDSSTLESIMSQMQGLGDILDQSAVIEQWEEPRRYSNHRSLHFDYCFLITDKTLTKVYIELGNI